MNPSENTPRYTVSANGQTVFDSKTGLTWDRSHMPHMPIMNWRHAVQTAKAANDSNRHGHADWRLPTRAELESLVDLSQNEGATCDQTAFPDCPESCFWTCETYEPDPAYAWIVNFDGGDTFANYKVNYYFVRLVRSGQ